MLFTLSMVNPSMSIIVTDDLGLIGDVENVNENNKEIADLRVQLGRLFGNRGKKWKVVTKNGAFLMDEYIELTYIIGSGLLGRRAYLFRLFDKFRDMSKDNMLTMRDETAYVLWYPDSNEEIVDALEDKDAEERIEKIGKINDGIFETRLLGNQMPLVKIEDKVFLGVRRNSKYNICEMIRMKSI